MNDSVLELYNRSVALKDKFRKILESQELDFKGDDVRVTLIARPLGSIILRILFFKSNKATFYNPSWWDEISIREIPEKARRGFAERVDTFYKYFIFIQLFSIVESEFRLLIRQMAPGELNDGKEKFNKIYKRVLSDLSLAEYENLFKFSSSIRNAVHNNGVHLPLKRDNETINFKDKNYEFIYGEEIDFLYPELLADIQDEIFNCLFEIINHEKIKNLG